MPRMHTHRSWSLPRVAAAVMVGMTVCLVAATPGCADPFTLPVSEEGLPGEGQLRRYDGYVKA